jgi:ankyrin repeat protein
MTPLHYAAWQGSIDCVQLLLEHKADINKADAVSDQQSHS